MSARHNFANVTQRLFNQPLALNPSHAAMIVSAIHSRLGVDLINLADGDFHYPGVSPHGRDAQLDRAAMRMLAGEGVTQARLQTEDRSDKRSKLFAHEQNVAIIPIEGTLTKSWGLEPESGFTGYDGIEAKFVAALADPEIKGIWLQIDSGGGDVAGLFPLVDLISASTMRNGGTKPVYAMISDYGYSAAYAIASAADKVFLPETGGAGSVGVITMHANYGPQISNKGIEVTIMRAGDQKAKPHPLEKIDGETVAKIQKEIEAIRGMFVDRVATNRGIPRGRVDQTQAATYMGEDAKAIGFVDKIASDHQAWAILQRQIARMS